MAKYGKCRRSAFWKLNPASQELARMSIHPAEALARCRPPQAEPPRGPDSVASFLEGLFGEEASRLSIGGEEGVMLVATCGVLARPELSSELGICGEAAPFVAIASCPDGAVAEYMLYLERPREADKIMLEDELTSAAMHLLDSPTDNPLRWIMVYGYMNRASWENLLPDRLRVKLKKEITTLKKRRKRTTIETARTTGKDQLLRTYQTDCGCADEEICDVEVMVRPDGTTYKSKTVGLRSYTW